MMPFISTFLVVTLLTTTAAQAEMICHLGGSCFTNHEYELTGVADRETGGLLRGRPFTFATKQGPIVEMNCLGRLPDTTLKGTKLQGEMVWEVTTEERGKHDILDHGTDGFTTRAECLKSLAELREAVADGQKPKLQMGAKGLAISGGSSKLLSSSQLSVIELQRSFEGKKLIVVPVDNESGKIDSAE